MHLRMTPIVTLNPSHVILSAAKNLVVKLRTGSVKSLYVKLKNVTIIMN